VANIPWNARRALSKAFSSVLDWFYPRHCYNCGESLSEGEGRILCRDCFRALESSRIRGTMCSRCGLPLSTMEGIETQCGICSQRDPGFDLARSFFPYASPVSGIIRSFKFDGDYFLGPMLMEGLVDLGWMPPEIEGVDGVVPIPLHPRRRRERGYDQALLLAETLARKMNWRLMTRAILRTRYTAQQARLTTQKRWENVRGAFQAHPKAELEGLHLLLLDDVMTTGATASECAKTLKKAGAQKVSVLSLARTTP